MNRGGPAVGWTGTARVTPLLVMLALAGCAPSPEVAFPPGPAGDYPQILPIDTLLAQADAPTG